MNYELCAFYTGKGDLQKQILREIWGAAALTAPYESATAGNHIIK